MVNILWAEQGMLTTCMGTIYEIRTQYWTWLDAHIWNPSAKTWNIQVKAENCWQFSLMPSALAEHRLRRRVTALTADYCFLEWSRQKPLNPQLICWSLTLGGKKEESFIPHVETGVSHWEPMNRSVTCMSLTHVSGRTIVWLIHVLSSRRAHGQPWCPLSRENFYFH